MLGGSVDGRSRKFIVGIAVAWLLLPLAGGIAGLGLAFAGVALPFVAGEYAQLLGCGVVGCLLGAACASVHTVWSYWRAFLR
jgi:hypothetical protein